MISSVIFATAVIVVNPGDDLVKVRDRARAEPGAEVVLKGGTYRLKNTLEFTAADSGVTWRAADGEKPEIAAGVEIPAAAFTPWSGKAGVMVADISACPVEYWKDSPREFTLPLPVPELFVDGRRMAVAAWPNHGGFTEVAKIVDEGTCVSDGTPFNKLKPTGERRGPVFLTTETRPFAWKHPGSTWLHGYWCYDWHDSVMPGAAFARETNGMTKVTLAQPHCYGMKGGAHKTPRRWRALHLLEELDAPGEYYVDREAKKLYFMPEGPLAAASRIVLTSGARPLVALNGASDVVFRGIGFTEGFGSGVKATKCRSVKFERCRFRNLRTLAADFAECTGCRVSDCEVTDTGTGGIVMAGGDRRTLTRGENVIERSVFRRFSTLRPVYTPGVRLGGCGNTVRHCELTDTPHMAAGMSGNDHVFEHCVISNACTCSDDAAAFYKGRDPSSTGNVIRHCLFSDIGSVRRHGNAAVYFDDGDCGERVEHCTFRRVLSPARSGFGAIFCHGGYSNVVSDCVFEDCERPLGYSKWKQDRWLEFIGGVTYSYMNTRLKKNVDVESPLFQERYPFLRGFMAGAPESNRCNVAVNCEFRNCRQPPRGHWDLVNCRGSVSEDLSAANPPTMPAEYLADPAEVVRAAAEVTARKFPDADSVMLDDRIHTAYEADGSYVMWDDEWVKVLTEKGRRANATVSLDVSLRYGDAAIELVEIVGTNGVTRKVDFKRTLKMATDNSSVASNIYDPLDQQLTCAVSGLAVGEIRHVRFCSRERKARMKGTWADTQLLEYSAPIVRTVISVDAPPELPVRHAAVRHPFKETVRRLADRTLPNGRKLSAWEARDVPQVFSEPAMPPLASEVQALRLSTAPDWPAVSRWYWEICRPHLAASSPAIADKVSELVTPCTNDLEKVRALFRFVSQEIRYMGLTAEDGAPGYEPHDVKLTFDNRYGVCRDKAALLARMLAIAGFRARPVLIHAGRKMDPEIPSPYFNHAVTAVKLGADADWTLMDPTDELSRDLLPSYLSDCSYLVADPAGEPLRTSPVVPMERNLLKVESEGSLSSDGSAFLTTRIAFGGINDTAARHLFGKKTERERHRAFEGILQRVAPGAELMSCEITPADLRDTETEMSLVAIARFPDVVLRGKSRDELALPFITREFSVVNALLSGNTALEKRRFPLELESTAGIDETLTIKTGEALGEVDLLPPTSRTGEGTGYECSRSFAVEDGKLTARRRQLLRKLRFEVPDYERLRDNLKLDEASERARPTFAVNENADADVRTVLNRREVCFFSPKSWVQTNTVEKEVLTYAGKKRSSELKLSYSPVTRAVELVSATVSNRNGKVHSISPKEVNLLDASWVASAPRYPASKILVANLPGVEIGSVIRYTVAYTVTNSPLAYTSFTIFDSTEPQDRVTVKLSVPDGMPFKWRETNLDVPGMVKLSDRVGSRRRFAWSAKKLPRAPDEPSQPAASLWRPTLFVTAADWRDYAGELTAALAAARAAGSGKAVAKAEELVRGCAAAEAKLAAIRSFLAHNVRISGPGLFELPFECAFTPPDRSLAEGYASSADYRNLMFAMLEAAGFECSFVFATDDSHGLKRMTRLYREELPRPDFFNTQVLRARIDGRTYYVTAENEYTPVDCSVREGDTFFDPKSLAFGEIRLEERETRAWYAPWTWFGDPTAAVPGASEWSPRDVNHTRLLVREDGGVDFDVTNRQYGAGVGLFRKRYAEMLPERRSRHFQSLLGNLADSATATRELVTDIEGYPAEMSFSAFVPEYATAQGGSITVRVPDLDDDFLSVGAFVRKSPISTGGAYEEETIREVVFPKGFTVIEHLPEPYVLKDPVSGAVWVEFTVKGEVEDDRLTVTLRRHVRRRTATVLGMDYAPFFRDWNRRMSSMPGRTLTVRKNSNFFHSCP